MYLLKTTCCPGGRAKRHGKRSAHPGGERIPVDAAKYKHNTAKMFRRKRHSKQNEDNNNEHYYKLLQRHRCHSSSLSPDPAAILPSQRRRRQGAFHPFALPANGRHSIRAVRCCAGHVLPVMSLRRRKRATGCRSKSATAVGPSSVPSPCLPSSRAATRAPKCPVSLLTSSTYARVTRTSSVVTLCLSAERPANFPGGNSYSESNSCTREPKHEA